MGFRTSPRTVVVLRRLAGVNQQLAEIGQEMEQTTAELDLARAALIRAEEHRDVILHQADRVQQDLLAFHTQMLAQRQRPKKACSSASAASAAAAVWGSANWKQASSIASTPLASELLRR